MHATRADAPAVSQLTARFSYPDGSHPATNLEVHEILHCYLCFEDYFDVLGMQRLAEARRIGDWLKAAMLDAQEGFKYGYSPSLPVIPLDLTCRISERLVNGNLVMNSVSKCWFPPVLARCNKLDEDIIVLILLVAEEKLGGSDIFDEFLRVTQIWEQDNRIFKTEVHHGNVQPLLKGQRTKNAEGGGIYVHLPPQIGSFLFEFEGQDVFYEGNAAAQEANEMGRRQINIGQTENFKQREAHYDRRGTNQHHTDARNSTLPNGQTFDTIKYWTREVLLRVPALTPGNKKIDSLLLRVLETILNIGFGATWHAKKRIWGLQTRFIDSGANTRRIDRDGALEFVNWYAQVVAPAHEWSVIGRVSSGPPHAVWKQIRDLRPPVPSVAAYDTIILLIRQQKGTHILNPASLPKIPISHWGGEQNIPDGWLEVYRLHDMTTVSDEARAFERAFQKTPKIRKAADEGLAASDDRAKQKRREAKTLSPKKSSSGNEKHKRGRMA